MIYEYPDSAAPIRQGDIFIRVPQFEVSMGSMPVLENDGSMIAREWCEIALDQDEVTAVLAIRPVAAIVATQDCDATRTRTSLCVKFGGFARCIQLLCRLQRRRRGRTSSRSTPA